MASLNKVQLIGNLGRDPELRHTPNGTAVCTVSLATTNAWNDKETHDRVEESEWHRVVFFARLAEVVGEYMKKGRPMYVEGRLQTRKWKDKDGKTSTRPRSLRPTCRCSARSPMRRALKRRRSRMASASRSASTRTATRTSRSSHDCARRTANRRTQTFCYASRGNAVLKGVMSGAGLLGGAIRREAAARADQSKRPAAPLLTMQPGSDCQLRSEVASGAATVAQVGC